MFTDFSTTITEGVRVDVSTAWIREQSNPSLDHYVFAYKVKITNDSPEQLQLLRRKWVITDGVGEKRVVQGEGVIGRKPVLVPGQEHGYISGCDFTTPIGKMSGFYYMLRSDGSMLKVRIPEFVMAVPFYLN